MRYFLGLYQSIRLKRLVLVVRVVCNYLDCFVDSIVATLCLPSLCGMLVYSEDTSMDNI